MNISKESLKKRCINRIENYNALEKYRIALSDKFEVIKRTDTKDHILVRCKQCNNEFISAYSDLCRTDGKATGCKNCKALEKEKKLEEKYISLFNSYNRGIDFE